MEHLRPAGGNRDAALGPEVREHVQGVVSSAQGHLPVTLKNGRHEVELTPAQAEVIRRCQVALDKYNEVLARHDRARAAVRPLTQPQSLIDAGICSQLCARVQPGSRHGEKQWATI